MKNQDAPEETSAREQMKQAAIRGGKAMVAGKILNQLISFGVVWVQAHFMPVWAYGLLGLFTGTVGYISTLGGAGTMVTAQRFLPEFAEKGDIRSIARTTRGLVIILMAASAIVLGLILLFFNTIGPLLKIEEYRELFAFFSIGIIFTLECYLMFTVHWALLKQPAYVLGLTIHNIFRLVAFYFVLKSGGGIAGALLVEGLSYLLLFAGLYIHFAVKYDIRAPKINDIPIKRMARYGIFMYSSNIGHIFFNTTTDLYVISAFMGKYELGLYAFAANLSQALMKWMPDRLVGSVIETVTYRDFTREGSKEMLKRYFRKVFTLQAFFTIPTAILLITFARPMIGQVFDPKFLPSAELSGVLALVFTIVAFKFPLNIVAATLEKPRVLFIAQTTFAVYNLIMDIILVPIIGLWGAVLATGTSYLFMVSTIWISLSRHVKLSIEAAPVLKIIANSVLMGAFFLLISRFVSSPIIFFASFILGGAIYLLLSYFNCPLDESTKTRLISAAQAEFGKIREKLKFGSRNAGK